MNKVEARKILNQVLHPYRSMSHAQLQKMRREPQIMSREGEGGVSYQIEIEVFWDDPRNPGGNLRVIGSIDDGGFFSSIRPLSADFIINPEGKMIGDQNEPS